MTSFNTSVEFSNIATSLSLVAVLLLLAFLIFKEITASIGAHRVQRLSNAISDTLVPLLISFALTATIRLVNALR